MDAHDDGPPEEEDEEEEQEDEYGDEGWTLGFLKERTAQFEKALRKHAVPAALAESLLSNLQTVEAEFSDDGSGEPRTASLTTRLSSSSDLPGVEFEVYVHNRSRWASVEFSAWLKWRPAGAAKWTRLGSAWLESAPDYGKVDTEEDFQNGGSLVQYEKCDTRLLTAAAVAHLQRALFGERPAAAVSADALVDLVLAASGWKLSALQTGWPGWLEQAFGLAAGAKVSKRYEPPNILDRQCEWAGRIFEEAEYEGEEEEEEEAAPPADEAGPLLRKHEQFAHGQPFEERARLLWEFVEQHGHLPWADPPWKRTISLFKRIGAMPAAGSAAVASLEQELAQSFARQRERRRLREEAELDGEEWDEEYDEEDDEEEDLPGRL